MTQTTANTMTMGHIQRAANQKLRKKNITQTATTQIFLKFQSVALRQNFSRVDSAQRSFTRSGF